MAYKFLKLLRKRKVCNGILCSSGISFILILTALGLLFNSTFRSILVIGILFVLGSLTGFFSRFTGNINVGIEFIPFTTIILFYTHGLTISLLLSILMILVTTVIFGRIAIDTFVSIGLFFIIGFISLILPLASFGIVVSGMILIVVFNILSFIVLMYISPDVIKNIVYFVGSIFFNYLLFRYFGQIVYKLLM